ncbi:MAG: hypothetical protein ACRCYE_09540 [Sarcina sp.]
MKKFLIAILCASAIAFAGCGASAKTPEDLQKKALGEVSEAINERWDEQDKLGEAGASKDQTIAILENEIKELEEAKVNVSDENIKKAIADYIEGVKLQIESVKTEDFMLMDEYMNKSEKLRKPALIKLVDEYGVSISEKNKQVYTDFKAKATVINKESEAEKFVDNLMNDVEFEKTKEYDWVTYKAIIENTSKINFESIAYNVKFVDKDGVVVDNNSIYIENFSEGSKHKIEFSSDEEHDNIKIEKNYFNLK